MAISPDVAGLAMSVVSGALKLGRKLDEIMAEEEALRSALAIPFPDVTLAPSLTKLRKTANRLLRDTQDQDPDPLGPERASIRAVLAGPTSPTTRTRLFDFCRKQGLIEALGIEVFRPDAAFQEALLERNAAWNLAEPDVHRLTYYLAAGPDRRRSDLAFRVGATVLDVLAEVAAQNTRLMIEHEPTRKLVETLLTRFAQPDLAAIDGWGGILEHSLRVTLNTVVDEREALAGGREWLERALSAVARTRDLAPNGDDFVLGLVRGAGFGALIRGVLATAAEHLSEGDEEVWEGMLSNLLLVAAQEAEGAPSFEAFFQENWHVLVGAGFAALEEHGPRLLHEDDGILQRTLTAAVGALAGSFAAGPPTGATLGKTVQAAISVFADPQALAPAVREAWLREMIASVAGVVRDDGLRTAFAQPALEGYARDTLEILSRYPEIFAEDDQLVQSLLSAVLGRMAEVETFAVGPLADATVEGALAAIAEKPELLGIDFAGTIGEVAGGLAQRVANGGIAGLQAQALVDVVVEVVATNEQLFVEARQGLAQAIVDSVLDVAEGHEEGLLTGAALVATVERVLAVVSTRGLGLPADPSRLQARLGEVLAAGLSRASEELGHRLAQSDVPQALAALVEMLAKGEEIPEIGTPELEALFATLADGIAA